MSAEDLLRVYGLSALEVVLGIAVMFLVVFFLRKLPWDTWTAIPQAKRYITIAAYVIMGIILVATIVSTLPSVTVNAAPRGIIDRSQVLDQQKAYEQKLIKKGEAE